MEFLLLCGYPVPKQNTQDTSSHNVIYNALGLLLIVRPFKSRGSWQRTLGKRLLSALLHYYFKRGRGGGLNTGKVKSLLYIFTLLESNSPLCFLKICGIEHLSLRAMNSYLGGGRGGGNGGRLWRRREKQRTGHALLVHLKPRWPPVTVSSRFR